MAAGAIEGPAPGHSLIGGATLVCGPREMRAQEAPKQPAWLGEALQRMRQTGLPGLAIAAPEEDRHRRTRGEDLLELVEIADDDVRDFLLECVIVCLTPELWKRHVAADGNRALLDAGGNVAATDTVEEALYADPAGFVGSSRAFVHGERRERLRERVEQLKSICAEAERRTIDEALRAVDTDGREPGAAMSALRSRAGGIVPWLVLARLEVVHKPGRERLRTLLRRTLAPRARAPRYPYGTKLPGFRALGCGRGWVEGDPGTPSVQCGMAEAPDASRRFLKFLTK